MINVWDSSRVILQMVWIVPLIIVSWMHPADISIYYTTAMIFLIVISSAVFLLIWRLFGKSVNFMQLQGIAFLYFAIFIFFQLLSSEQMHILPLVDKNRSLQYILFGRMIRSTLIGLSLIALSRIKLIKPILISSFFIVLLLILLIANTKSIPPFYHDGAGVSQFGKNFEIVLFLLRVVILLGFIKNINRMHGDYFLYAVISTVLSIITSLITMMNMMKLEINSVVPLLVELCSAGIFYRAVLSFDKQYYNQLRNVKKNEQSLRKTRSELEIRIAQRNQELERLNRDLEVEIEKRKAQECALRQSEERFRIVLNNMKIRVAHCDNQLRYTWLYDPFDLHLDKDVIGLTDVMLSSEPWSTEIMELKRDVVQSGIGKQKEVEIPNKNNEKLVFNLIAEPFFESEKLTGVTTVSFDITEKKRYEQNLEQRRHAIESIYTIATTFNSSKEQMYEKIAYEIVSILNVSSVVLSKLINGQINIITSCSNGIFKHDGGCLSNCCHCGTFQSIQDCTQDSLVLQGGTLSANLGVPVKNQSGDIIGLICVLDSVEHVFTKEQMNMVEIFCRYIANEIEKETMVTELLHAKEMAVLGQLTSGVAHEVRNPLNAIWAVTEALFLELEDKPDTLVYKEHIKTQVNRLSRLMRDLLDLGRPAVRSVHDKFSIKKLCRETVDLWAQNVPEKRAAVIIDTDAFTDSIILHGDSAKIQQIVINLLDNAFEHSPPQTTIRTTANVDKFGWFELNVIDAGVGIQKEIMGRIFEPFFTTRKRGVGLGLSIVRHIVDLHKGTVTVLNNTNGPGVTVKIRMPLRKADGANDSGGTNEFQFVTV